MRSLWGIPVVLLLGAAGTVWAVADGTRSSIRSIASGQLRVQQLFNCDNSGSLASSDAAADGEICEDGDWVKAMDCRGAKTATVYYFEYGAGTGEVDLWDCIPVVGESNQPFTKAGGGISSIASPGVEDPSASPSSSDPDPLCVNTTESVTFDGTTTKKVNITDSNFTYMVAKLSCTGNCDGRAVLVCDFGGQP